LSKKFNKNAPGVRVCAVDNEKSVDSEPIDLDGRVIGFSFEDSDNKVDKVSIQLDNHDLSMFERPEFVGGKMLEVSWGYWGNMSPPRRVTLDKMKGFTTLTLEGHANSYLMHKRAKARCWENKTRSEIVEEIAKEHGYEGQFLHVQKTNTRYDVINQTGETDARFLRRLAAKENFRFYVDDTGFHWHGRRFDTAPFHIFTWHNNPISRNVISISIESDLTRRVGGVTVKSRNPIYKQTVEEKANNDTVDRHTLGEVIEVIDKDKKNQRTRDDLLVDYEDPLLGQSIVGVRVGYEDRKNEMSVLDERNAIALHYAMYPDKGQSKAKFIKAERKTVKLNMTVVGDPTLQAKSVVVVLGISPALSGKYYVKSVKHNVSSSGYTCQMKLIRDAKGRLARKAKQQGGKRNTAATVEKDEIREVEKYGSREDGFNTWTEFYRGDKSVGHQDGITGQTVIGDNGPREWELEVGSSESEQ